MPSRASRADQILAQRARDAQPLIEFPHDRLGKTLSQAPQRLQLRQILLDGWLVVGSAEMLGQPHFETRCCCYCCKLTRCWLQHPHFATKKAVRWKTAAEQVTMSVARRPPSETAELAASLRPGKADAKHTRNDRHRLVTADCAYRYRKSDPVPSHLINFTCY